MAKYVGPELPPFDPNAKCPKCGYDAVFTHYHGRMDDGVVQDAKLCNWAWWDWEGTERVRLAEGETSEHLHRTCERCEYEWIERCIEESPVTGSGESCQHDDCCYTTRETRARKWTWGDFTFWSYVCPWCGTAQCTSHDGGYSCQACHQAVVILPSSEEPAILR